MTDAFERQLKARFADVEPPETLHPENVAELLKKQKKPDIRLSAAKIAGIAAAFALVIFSAAYFAGVSAQKNATDEAAFDMTVAGAEAPMMSQAGTEDYKSDAANDGLQEPDPRDLDGDGTVTDEEIAEYEKLNGEKP